MSQKTKGSRAHSLDSPTARRVGGAAASKSSLCGKNPPKRPEIGKVASGTKKGLPYSHKSKHTDLPLTQPASAMHSVSSPVGTGHDGLSKSAAVAKLERELADLKKENASLRKELTEVRTMHEQLIHESPEENFSEKRVNLLKSQILQLERQVLLMTQALGTRGELLVDLFNMMEQLEEREKSSSSPGADVLQKITTLKLRLSKYMQTGVVENLAQPVRFLDAFIKPKRVAVQGGSGGAMQGGSGGAIQGGSGAVTLVDVCRAGAVDSINIKHVSRLESKLAELYGQLVQLKTSLETAPPRTGNLFQPIREHCRDHVTKSCNLIGGCCHDLLCLSLLLPAAPWPPLRGNEVSLSFSVNDILKSVPTKAKKEVKESLEAAMVAFNYSTDMQEKKCKSMEGELQFHKAVYDLQAEYVDSLFKAVRSGYEEFEQSLQELVCTPVNTLLTKFDTLAQSGSEAALGEFLSSFKQSYPELKDAVRRIRNPDDASASTRGVKALSSFGQQFFQQLHKLEEECSKQRHVERKP